MPPMERRTRLLDQALRREGSAARAQWWGDPIMVEVLAPAAGLVTTVPVPPALSGLRLKLPATYVSIGAMDTVFISSVTVGVSVAETATQLKCARPMCANPRPGHFTRFQIPGC
jgi:hypothetical protein